MNQLESLAKHTVLVADTGDVEEIARFPVQDATTNPSLVAKAIQDPQTRGLVEKALVRARAESSGEAEQAGRFVDLLFVALGRAGVFVYDVSASTRARPSRRRAP